MSDQIQRDDGEWQMLLNNAHSMVESLTNKVEAREAQIESLQRENEDLREHVKEAEAGAEEANELVKILGKRPAITPEMMERMKGALKGLDALPEQSRKRTPLEDFSRSIFRDLLGEQG